MKKIYYYPMILATVACTMTAPKQEKVDVMPADKKANERTIAMYSKLQRSTEKGYLIGHQDDLAYGHSWNKEIGRSDIKDVCGDYPAIFGWELGDLETGKEYSLDSVYFSDIQTYMAQVDSMGGLNTLSWHSNNIVTGGNCWDVTSNEVVASVLPNGANHAKYLSWLDTFAEFVTSVKDKDGNPIPILFRPYHELSGSWFWWGHDLCSSDQYKTLWRMTFEYLTNQKNVHNLMYCYSLADVTSKEAFMERYPGDDVVDLIGFDIYQYGTKDEFIAKLKGQSNIVSEIAKEHKKLWAVCEGGYESIPDSSWFTTAIDSTLKNTNTTYVLFWRNAHDKPNHFYAPYKGHASETDFNAFVKSPKTLMLKDFCIIE